MTTCKGSDMNSGIDLDKFAAAHRTDDISKLALTLSQGAMALTEEERTYILRQIEGWQKLRTKVPSWASTEGLLYPVRLSLEQCSSEFTAQYKAEVARKKMAERIALPIGSIRNTNFCDLTGGLGVDFAFIARNFTHATYVERNDDLCRIARHNFPLLGLPEAEVIEGDGVEWICEGKRTTDGGQRTTDNRQRMEGGLFIYLDPFRRDDSGHKTVRIEDCTPNVVELLPALRALAAAQTSREGARNGALHVMVKLSPMLDITAALRMLPEAREVHIVGHAGEVKEVLICLSFGRSAEQNTEQTNPDSEQSLHPIKIICHDEQHHFEYLLGDAPNTAAAPEEMRVVAPEDITAGTLLHDPAPVIMKAGCFQQLCAAFGVAQLQPNSHLFIAMKEENPGNTLQMGFPGRAFRVIDMTTLGKRALKEYMAAASRRQGTKTLRANLATRNFPQSVAELRKRLRLLDGGSEYWFATTLADGTHTLIACEKTVTTAPL